MSEEKIREIINQHLIENIMTNLDSAMIFTYISNLEKENKKLKGVIETYEILLRTQQKQIDDAKEWFKEKQMLTDIDDVCNLIIFGKYGVIVMNKEEIEELKNFTIDITDIDELALGLEVCSKKSNMVIQEFADLIIELQQENKQLKEQVVIMEKYLELIHDLGYDYDGLNQVDSLKTLIDELVKYASLGRVCNLTEPIYENNDIKYNILHQELENGKSE